MPRGEESAKGEEDVTRLLQAWRRGDDAARNALLERVYVHLKRIAAAQLRGERFEHTLQPTALVHEAYLRLVDQAQVDWRDRAHFFGLVSTTMRRVLIDHARRRASRKRRPGDAGPALTIAGAGGAEVDLLDLDRALERLAAESARAARVVEMRYFAGLEIDEVASCLEISPATVKRDWEFARAWMRVEMQESP
jgi:RNA polymerase sigma factor (TIGR02999 family)